jgi:hypothetical protein
MLLFFLIGCGTPSVRVDAGTAQESLTLVLDRWKEGKKPADLLEESPPIEVQELEWSNGAKLLEYEIISDDQSAGQGLVAWVKLKLSSEGGKTIEKTAKYVVNTSPDVRVLRIMMK